MGIQKILNWEQCLQKTRRIAYEIVEQNIDETSMIIAGIDGSGYTLASMLADVLKEISGMEIILTRISLHKDSPLQSDIELDIPLDQLTQKVIILVDDVLNTGRTLAYSLKPFLNADIKKLQTAVLIDRGYKNFPISADFVGYSLATTIREHVTVVMDKVGEEQGVFLN